MEDRLRKHVDTRYDELRGEVQETHSKHLDKLNSKLAEVLGQVDELQKKADALDDEIRAELNSLSDDIHEVSDEIENRVEFMIDDAVVGIKVDLEKFVEHELKNAEDAVKDSLRQAKMSIEFNDE